MTAYPCPICSTASKRTFGYYNCPTHGKFSPHARRKAERIPEKARKLHNRFEVGSGAYKCGECGKATRETGKGESGVGLCASCYEQNELDNLESDNK
jgi:hypothetical protein